MITYKGKLFNFEHESLVDQEPLKDWAEKFESEVERLSKDDPKYNNFMQMMRSSGTKIRLFDFESQKALTTPARALLSENTVRITDRWDDTMPSLATFEMCNLLNPLFSILSPGKESENVILKNNDPINTFGFAGEIAEFQSLKYYHSMTEQCDFVRNRFYVYMEKDMFQYLEYCALPYSGNPWTHTDCYRDWFKKVYINKIAAQLKASAAQGAEQESLFERIEQWSTRSQILVLNKFFELTPDKSKYNSFIENLFLKGVKNNNVHIVKVILENQGLSKEFIQRYNKQLMLETCRQESPTLVSILQSYGFATLDNESLSEDEQNIAKEMQNKVETIKTKMKQALEYDNPDMLKECFKEGMTVDMVIHDGIPNNSPVWMYAIFESKPKVLGALLERGALPELDVYANRSALHNAMLWGNRKPDACPEICRLLIQHNVDPNSQNIRKQDFLQFAEHNNFFKQEELWCLFSDFYPDKKKTFYKKYSQIMQHFKTSMSTTEGKARLASIIKSMPIEAKQTLLMPWLKEAVEYGNLPVVELILETGGLSAFTSQAEQAPLLHLAFVKDSKEIFDKLIKHGANIYLTHEGESLFDLSSQDALTKNQEIMQELLNATYEEHQRINSKNSELYINAQSAINNGDISALEQCLKKGLTANTMLTVDNEESGEEQISAFRYAITYGNTDVIRTFLEKNPKLIQEKYEHGYSLLHFAASKMNAKDFEDLYRLCVEFNTDVHTVDRYGRSFIDIAKQNTSIEANVTQKIEKEIILSESKNKIDKQLLKSGILQNLDENVFSKYNPNKGAAKTGENDMQEQRMLFNFTKDKIPPAKSKRSEQPARPKP